MPRGRPPLPFPAAPATTVPAEEALLRYATGETMAFLESHGGLRAIFERQLRTGNTQLLSQVLTRLLTAASAAAGASSAPVTFSVTTAIPRGALDGPLTELPPRRVPVRSDPDDSGP